MWAPSPLRLGTVTFGRRYIWPLSHAGTITSERRSIWAPFRLRAVTFVGRYILDAFTSGRHYIWASLFSPLLYLDVGVVTFGRRYMWRTLHLGAARFGRCYS